MGTTVKASGMVVQARADTGIVIRNVNTESGTAVYNAWGTSASAQHTAAVTIAPTSTLDCTNWYTATSALFDDAQAHQTADGAYTALNVISARTDVYNNNNYACYKYNIKVSGQNDMNVLSLDVSSVKATITGEQQSPELNKALRVGVVMASGSGLGTLAGIYAPISGATTNYYVANGSSCTPKSSNEVARNTNITTIPHADDALSAYVYVWFEGEDGACKSSNITGTLDNITIEVTFGYTATNS